MAGIVDNPDVVLAAVAQVSATLAVLTGAFGAFRLQAIRSMDSYLADRAYITYEHLAGLLDIGADDSWVDSARTAQGWVFLLETGSDLCRTALDRLKQKKVEPARMTPVIVARHALLGCLGRHKRLRTLHEAAMLASFIPATLDLVACVVALVALVGPFSAIFPSVFSGTCWLLVALSMTSLVAHNCAALWVLLPFSLDD